MPAEEHLSGLQFEYQSPSDAEEEFGRAHGVLAMAEGRRIGNLHWTTRVGVTSVMVAPENQRQGVATAMWNEAHRLAAEKTRIPTPRHSNDRTDEGDAWARSVGGSLPRRK